MSRTVQFLLPTKQKSGNNKERRVGFEFEFSGLKAMETAVLIKKLWGGTIKKRNRFDIKITGGRLGDFSVELDAGIIKKDALLSALGGMGIKFRRPTDRESWQRLVEKLANTVVPYEICTPPLPLSRLKEVEKLRRALHRQHARGTKAKYQYAFGMHMNPEIPDRFTRNILNILRSFLLHYPWLLKKLAIDWTRRISPFIRPFPDAYLALVLDPSYRPGRHRLILDYLKHNPTRNRPLDLLPLFCLLEEKTVRRVLPKEKINPRPAFHYRLPNCLLDDPEWRVADEWNYWVRIEELALDAKHLKQLSEELLSLMNTAPLLWQAKWKETFPGHV